MRSPVVAASTVDTDGRHAGAPPALTTRLDVDLGGRAKLIGADVAAHAAPGSTAAVTLQWLVLRNCTSLSPRVFVHAAAPGAALNLAGADHEPPQPAFFWEPGDVVIDRFTIPIPTDIGVDELAVYAGFLEKKERWATSPPQDDDRVEVGRLHVDGAPALHQSADVRRVAAGSPIVVDGKLDEPAWAQAASLGPFASWDGKSRISRRTTAKLAWDDAALYVAFLGDDPDAFTPYTKDDDPLYDSEAIEIFVDADGDKDVYVELQAAPANDLHFDAAFAGGRRKNMDRGYRASYATKTVVAGARFTSEWRIPVADLRDIPAGEPKAGAVWRVNLFRLERVRDAAKKRVVANEASAWSSPLSGDFHNLDRFGSIRFVE